jgi:addiction module HigA family antidote
MVRIPTDRPPTHPGEMLLEEFLNPLDMARSELARRTGIPSSRVNGLVQDKRALTLDTAKRLARFFGTSLEFWMYLQLRWDLYAAEQEKDEAVERIQPFNAETVSFTNLIAKAAEAEGPSRSTRSRKDKNRRA